MLALFGSLGCKFEDGNTAEVEIAGNKREGGNCKWLAVGGLPTSVLLFLSPVTLQYTEYITIIAKQ